MEETKRINLECSELWWKSDKKLNLDIKKYTAEEKKIKENRLDNYIDLIIEKVKNFPKEDDERILWKAEINKIIDDFIYSEKDTFKLGILNEEFKENFFDSTKTFIRKAKEFDKNLNYVDIGQAMRNVWIINLLQASFGEKVEFSKAILGYSMLYPYTDNYLDDIKIDINEKKDFNHNLKKKLKGEVIESKNEYEKLVYKLVEYIEKTFERNKYNKLYEALLLIHEGQIKSLNQQEYISVPYENNILEISIEKGGSSVLVDGFLTKGKLNKDEISFCIFYGFLLQLADDLQDVKIDIANNHTTIMSQLASRYKLDTIANKLINFTLTVLNDSTCFKGRNIMELKELIKINCIMLILFSVILSKEFFSIEYIKSIEQYLPFSIKYIEKIKYKLRKKVRKLKFEDALNYILDTK